MTMIKVSHISKIYKNDSVETVALSDVSFDIDKGEFVAIMGPSGSGKSTLMHILGALDSPTSGSYILDGKNIWKWWVFRTGWNIRQANFPEGSSKEWR